MSRSYKGINNIDGKRPIYSTNKVFAGVVSVGRVLGFPRLINNATFRRPTALSSSRRSGKSNLENHVCTFTLICIFYLLILFEVEISNDDVSCSKFFFKKIVYWCGQGCHYNEKCQRRQIVFPACLLLNLKRHSPRDGIVPALHFSAPSPSSSSSSRRVGGLLETFAKTRSFAPKSRRTNILCHGNLLHYICTQLYWEPRFFQV